MKPSMRVRRATIVASLALGVVVWWPDRASAAYGCSAAQAESHSDFQGWSWNRAWYCNSTGGARMYADASRDTYIGWMDTTYSWFVCWRRGDPHEGGNDIWYYSQGDRSRGGYESRHAWGFMPAIDVSTTVDPHPEIPSCPTSSGGGNAPIPGGVGPQPSFQLPFQCGERWRIDSSLGPDTNDPHAPALDMFRYPDDANTEGSVLVAAADGIVRQSFWHENPDNTGAGHVIQIDHGGRWFTTYIHLQDRLVKQNDRVYQGQPIGHVGSTGTTSGGRPHLHFEMGIDANGDGKASWGTHPSERVKGRLNGINYSEPNTLAYAYSNNCGDMPAAVAQGSRMHVFARGTNRFLYRKTYTGGTWGGWARVDSKAIGSAPAAVAWTDANGTSRIDVFALSAPNGEGRSEVLHRVSVNGGNSFGAWQNIGGVMTTQLAATVMNGALYLFGRGTNGSLYSRTYVRNWDGVSEYYYTWNPWERRTNDRLNSAPSATTYFSQVQVWYTRSDRRAYQIFWDGPRQSWTTPGQPAANGTNIISAMGVTRWNNNFEVYGRGSDGMPYFKSYGNLGGWSSWFRLTAVGPAESGVAAIVFGGNTVLFARSQEGNLLWSPYTNGWVAWEDLGGVIL